MGNILELDHGWRNTLACDAVHVSAVDSCYIAAAADRVQL